MNDYIHLTPFQLRALIRGEWHWIRCPDCDGTGYINYNVDTGEGVLSGISDKEDRITEECDTCEGVGYITREEMEE